MEKKQVKIEPQKIQMVPVDELIPYVRNPKKHPEEQINKIAKLIKEMGFKGAILVDKNKEIIAGHGRLLAAQKLGIKEVPVIIDKTLSPEQVKALRIADNKVAEGAEWIEEFLKSEIMQLDLENYNLSLTGLDSDEIDEFMDVLKINTKGDLVEKKVDLIKPYIKTHVLLSFPPDKFAEIKALLEQILDIEGIEYEQSSN